MGIGDWGLGIGDWGLGIGANPQSPIYICLIIICIFCLLILKNLFVFISLSENIKYFNVRNKSS